VSVPAGVAEKQETTAPEVSGLGMDDGEREAGGDSGIDGIASGSQHLHAGARGKFVDAGDDGVRSVRGAQRRGRAVGGAESREAAEDENTDQTTYDRARSNAHGRGETTRLA
jgi:hypothetical protein